MYPECHRVNWALITITRQYPELRHRATFKHIRDSKLAVKEMVHCVVTNTQFFTLMAFHSSRVRHYEYSVS